jgi:hypothetical protein
MAKNSRHSESDNDCVKLSPISSLVKVLSKVDDENGDNTPFGLLCNPTG